MPDEANPVVALAARIDDLSILRFRIRLRGNVFQIDRSCERILSSSTASGMKIAHLANM